MQNYIDYIAQRTAQEERQAQLVARYSDKPSPRRNKALWAANSVERHTYADLRLTVRILACIGLFTSIFLLWCILG